MNTRVVLYYVSQKLHPSLTPTSNSTAAKMELHTDPPLHGVVTLGSLRLLRHEKSLPTFGAKGHNNRLVGREAGKTLVFYFSFLSNMKDNILY